MQAGIQLDHGQCSCLGQTKDRRAQPDEREEEPRKPERRHPSQTSRACVCRPKCAQACMCMHARVCAYLYICAGPCVCGLYVHARVYTHPGVHVPVPLPEALISTQAAQVTDACVMRHCLLLADCS